MGQTNSKIEKEKEEPVVPQKPEQYSKALICHVQKMIDKENAKKRKTVYTQTRPSFLLRKSRRSGTPSWFSYDLDVKGNVVKDGIQIHCGPVRLARDDNLPVLTLEMLQEKQDAAERKRLEHLEQKRNAMVKRVDHRHRQGFEQMEREAKIAEMVENQRLKQARAVQNRKVFMDARRKAARLSTVTAKSEDKSTEAALQRQAIIMKLTLKQSRAEANRKEQLHLVVAKASNALHEAKNELVDAKRKVKAHLTKTKTERKMKKATENKNRMVKRVKNKQYLIEFHSKQVRARLEKQKQEEEEVNEFDRFWNAVECDEHYCTASDSDEDARWG